MVVCTCSPPTIRWRSKRRVWSRPATSKALATLIAEHPALVTARIGDYPDGMSRTLLHAATDWPGHFPNNPQVVQLLIDAGADVDARFTGPHTETPLHWAASSDDVDVIDVLLDNGADIEATGAVIAGGTPLVGRHRLRAVERRPAADRAWCPVEHVRVGHARSARSHRAAVRRRARRRPPTT